MNYIVGDRRENTFSLTSSLVASALGAWILFGPASASTWGGIGAVFGYALGTATPMFLLYNFGPKIRKEFPKGLSLTEFIKKRFGIKYIKDLFIFNTILFNNIFNRRNNRYSILAKFNSSSSTMDYFRNNSNYLFIICIKRWF